MVKLTVYFDEPFWVGVFERIEDTKLETARVVFGSEPKDYEVYAFISENYNNLKFGKPVIVELGLIKRINPKRQQRKIRQVVSDKGVSTKAQQAMKLEQESKKLEYKKASKEQLKEMAKLKFRKRQEKKKEKKKGR